MWWENINFLWKRPWELKITVVFNNLENFKFGKQNPWGEMQLALQLQIQGLHVMAAFSYTLLFRELGCL